MATNKTREQAEESYRNQRRFEQKVLVHLNTHGPQSYDGLYDLFDPYRNAEIRRILYEMSLWDLIAIGEDSSRTVSITTSGLARLKESYPPRLKIV